MGSRFFQAVKGLIVRIVRLFIDGIAELHISGGEIAFSVNLGRMTAIA